MSNSVNIWQCPSCRAPLVQDAQGHTCESGHRYDRAKQGYVNLLLANQKNSRDPGDSASMVGARRDFLSAGHYDFLMDAITQTAMQQLTDELPFILDLGCGEGSYLKALVRKLPGASIYGCDISKCAIKRAATWVQEASFGVASNFNLPVMSDSIDLALCVFAPLNYAELTRVLKGSGVLVRVLPGPDHLAEIKRLLYSTAEQHQIPESPGRNLETCHVRETHTLNANALKLLLEMTPLKWAGSKDAKQQLLKQPETRVTFDFIVQVTAFD